MPKIRWTMMFMGCAAMRGEAGVSQMLAILKEELEVVMALTDQSDVRGLDSDLALNCT